MQGFEGKKRMFRVSPLPVLMFGTPARIATGCDGLNTQVITTRLRQSQRDITKMLYLNQMHKKKAIEGYA